jgi:hypothetical protein
MRARFQQEIDLLFTQCEVDVCVSKTLSFIHWIGSFSPQSKSPCFNKQSESSQKGGKHLAPGNFGGEGRLLSPSAKVRAAHKEHVNAAFRNCLTPVYSVLHLPTMTLCLQGYNADTFPTHTRLLQMLVGIGRYVVGFVLPTERYRSIMYQYITNNDRCQRQKPIVWNRCLTKVMHLVGGEK